MEQSEIKEKQRYCWMIILRVLYRQMDFHRRIEQKRNFIGFERNPEYFELVKKIHRF